VLANAVAVVVGSHLVRLVVKQRRDPVREASVEWRLRLVRSWIVTIAIRPVIQSGKQQQIVRDGCCQNMRPAALYPYVTVPRHEKEHPEIY